MTSKLQVTRRFNNLLSNVLLDQNYFGTSITYIFKNKIVSSIGSTITLNWFRDFDAGAFATGASFASISSSGFPSNPTLLVSFTQGAYLSIIPDGTIGLAMPPNSSFTIRVNFNRIISTGVWNGFVKGVNYNTSLNGSIITETTGTNNSLTINLENPGTPAIDPNQSYTSAIVSNIGVNTVQTFTIRAVSATGANLTHGGGAFNLTLSGGANYKRSIVDNGNGTYTATYSVASAGTWTLSVTNASGTFIRDLPITLTVV